MANLVTDGGWIHGMQLPVQTLGVRNDLLQLKARGNIQVFRAHAG